jgi:hypothetical protein
MRPYRVLKKRNELAELLRADVSTKEVDKQLEGTRKKRARLAITYRARKNDFYIKCLDKDGKMVRVLASDGAVLRPGDTREVRERYF